MRGTWKNKMMVKHRDRKVKMQRSSKFKMRGTAVMKTEKKQPGHDES
jgi:hypothetical protein